MTREKAEKEAAERAKQQQQQEESDDGVIVSKVKINVVISSKLFTRRVYVQCIP